MMLSLGPRIWLRISFFVLLAFALLRSPAIAADDVTYYGRVTLTNSSSRVGMVRVYGPTMGMITANVQPGQVVVYGDSLTSAGGLFPFIYVEVNVTTAGANAFGNGDSATGRSYWAPGDGVGGGEERWISAGKLYLGEAVEARKVIDVGSLLSYMVNGAKPLWRAPGGEGETWDSQGPNLFREGVDLLYGVMKQSQVDTLASESEQVARLVIEREAAKPTDYAQNVAGEAAADAVSALYPSAPTSMGYTLSPSGSSSMFAVTLPPAFGGATFDLDPFREDRLGPVVDAFRTATSILVLVVLALWISNRITEWTRGVATVQQAKGNTVAGTGGQATALLAAGFITAAIVTFTTALFGWSLGELDIPDLINSLTTNPLATVPADVLYMLNKVFPVYLMLAALVARVTFNLYASTLFSVLNSVVRFVVP